MKLEPLCDCAKFGVNTVDTNYGKGGYDHHQHEIAYGHYECGLMYYTPSKPFHSSSEEERNQQLEDFHKVAAQGCWKCKKPVSMV